MQPESSVARSAVCFIFAFLLTAGSLLAQPPGPPPSRERVQRLRIAFFSERIDLTAAEAQRFWPVYNEYAEELDGIRVEMNQLIRENRRATNPTEKELDEALDRYLELQEREVTVKRQYHHRFRQVLTARKVAQLYRAENEFRMWLIDQLRARREARGGGRFRN